MPSKKVSHLFVFWTFLKIGATAFGGFMALIAAIENVVVKQKKLLTHEEILDGISLANMEEKGEIESGKIEPVVFCTNSILHSPVNAENPKWLYQQVDKKQEKEVGKEVFGHEV